MKNLDTVYFQSPAVVLKQSFLQDSAVSASEPCNFDLSDQGVCERWVYDPYFQSFCGEEYFQFELPIERSSMTRWRHRIGAQGLEKVFHDSLGGGHRTGALRTRDLERVTVDSPVQEKAITFPPDARLMHTARHRLVRLAREHGVPVRQSAAPRQAGFDHARALPPRQAAQAGGQGEAHAQDLSPAHHPRHPAPDVR